MSELSAALCQQVLLDRVVLLAPLFDLPDTSS